MRASGTFLSTGVARLPEHVFVRKIFHTFHTFATAAAVPIEQSLELCVTSFASINALSLSGFFETCPASALAFDIKFES